MLFSANLFAAFLAVAAVGVIGSPVDVQKDGQNNGSPAGVQKDGQNTGSPAVQTGGLGTFSYCEGEQFAEPCQSQQVTAGQCYNVLDAYKQKVKSIKPLDASFNCDLFPNADCQGDSKALPPAAGYPQLSAVSLDDVVASFKCHA